MGENVNKLRIVFLGTPEFAATCLETILEGRHEVVGVVTAPVLLGYGGNIVLKGVNSIMAEIKIDKSYLSLMAEYWNYDNDAISNLFHNSYKMYNKSVDFLNGEKPKGIDWHVLAPPTLLQADGYYLHVDDVNADYRLGLEVGLDFLAQLKENDES